MSALVPPHALAGNRFYSREARISLLREAGVRHLVLMTPEDIHLVRKSRTIAAQSFRDLFGGDSYHERPHSKERNILCVNRAAQPYAPRSPGESGLVFKYPDDVLLGDKCEVFHLFLNLDPKRSRTGAEICYIGTYSKVPIVHAIVEPGEWESLPLEVSGIPLLLLVSLCLMAHCSVVHLGYVVFILQQELMCVKYKQEYLYENGVRHFYLMPFASGRNKIQGGRRTSQHQTSGLLLVLVKRWVLCIDLPLQRK